MRHPFFTIVTGHLTLSLEKRYRELERLKDLAVFLKAQQLQLEDKRAALSKQQEAGNTARETCREAEKAFLHLRRSVEEQRAKADAVRDQLCSAGNPLFYSIRSYFSPYANPPIDQLKARYHKLTRRTHDAEDQLDEARQAYLTAREAYDSTQGLIDSVEFALRATIKDYNDTMDAMVAVHQEIDELIHESVEKTPVHLYSHYSSNFRHSPDLLKTILRLKRMLTLRKHLNTYVVPLMSTEVLMSQDTALDILTF